MSGKQTNSAGTNTSTPSKSSSTPRQPVLTPSSTPSATPDRHPDIPGSAIDLGSLGGANMDAARDEKAVDEVDPNKSQDASHEAARGDSTSGTSPLKKSKAKSKCAKDHKHKSKGKKSKKAAKHDSSSSSSDSDEDEDTSTTTTSDSESSSSSEDEKLKKKKKLKAKAKRKAEKKKKKFKKQGKSKRAVAESSSSDDDSESDESDSESEDDRRRRRRPRRSHRTSEEDSAVEEEDAADYEDDEVEVDPAANAKLSLAALQQQLLQQQLNRSVRRPKAAIADATTSAQNAEIRELLQRLLKKDKKGRGRKDKGKKKPKKASTLEYKRVDQLWDSTIHNYKLTESAEDKVDEFDEYVFCVRRKFDWENKYRNTVVDIKSKFLREALAEVMKDVKGVSLVEDQPSIDPNMLFLYLEEIRTYYKKTLKARLKKEKKRKIQKRIKTTIAQCRVLVGYLDEDYEDTKKRLYPMLEAGNITFDLLWALFKPNSIAFTSTYGSWDEPRCFKVDYANKEASLIKGEWYSIEGRYLEYDGKNFGLGDFEVSVEKFHGPRKITSLTAYPLQYHKDPEGVTKRLVERGKRFVELAGMNYRFHKGLAFHKKKMAVLRFNINGRIMIDPSIFRRINPNYSISPIKPTDPDDLFSSADDEEEGCGCGSDSDDDWRHTPKMDDDDDAAAMPKTKWKLIKLEDDEYEFVEVPVDRDGREIREQRLQGLAKSEGESSNRIFSEEELLIASSVVLGFAFSEKAWLEFTLSGVRDIEWDNQAFESLVLPEDRKSIVKALVSAHKFHPAQTIDDVVQGKGKGLVFVLHGSPGVGKTLTAEGIAEFLKCPLYSVTAGELGTVSHVLEQELQKIMDIAHSWGAVLLLDEADVFLEKREHQDVHRNALVSIFLRLLEYFQGILFLTTNRVDTFDDAFQSRIHLPLRYEELSFKTKKEIWKMFLEKVRAMEESNAASQEASSSSTTTTPASTTSSAQNPQPESEPKQPEEQQQQTPRPTSPRFTDSDLSTLARVSLNGRQIKNCVRTAQAIAVNEGVPLCMEHIRRVLDVAESFDRDLKGGTGYVEAMRSYT